mgnify:CR=1 FL=1
MTVDRGIDNIRHYEEYSHHKVADVQSVIQVDLEVISNQLQDDLQDKENSHDYRGGYLELIHGARMFLCKSTLDLKPQVGDFYFFPHYLMHAVFPFKGTDDERRSISFNATIDEEIYNVYGS